MADLIETTLARPVGASDRMLPLTSATSVAKGDYLYLDGETVLATAAPIGSVVRVMRGVAGAPGVAHAAGVAVFAGLPSRFHTTDPAGTAPAAPDDNPWINMAERRVWRAQGDAHGPGSANRVWVLVETSYPVGALGIRSAPTSTP